MPAFEKSCTVNIVVETCPLCRKQQLPCSIKPCILGWSYLCWGAINFQELSEQEVFNFGLPFPPIWLNFLFFFFFFWDSEVHIAYSALYSLEYCRTSVIHRLNDCIDWQIQIFFTYHIFQWCYWCTIHLINIPCSKSFFLNFSCSLWVIRESDYLLFYLPPNYHL